jgi:membrane protein implicated in regulation of membrane protease activity
LDNKGDGEIILILGIAVLLTGIGVGIYSVTFSSLIASAVNTIPAWFGNVIAVTFTVLGIVLIVLGARESGFHYSDNDAKT